MAVEDIPRKAEGVVYIYALYDPTTDAVRYIGKTVNPSARLGQHIREVRRGRLTHAKAWLKALLAQNLRPTMRVIETCCASTWEARERALIAEHKAAGSQLTNTASGGNEPHRTLGACRKGAAVTNSSSFGPVIQLTRTMSSVAAAAARCGDTARAEYFEYVASRIRNSEGAARDALNAFAKRKFSLG